jgi:hypothetical protein
LVIVKQVEEIQHLRQIGSHALAMDNIEGPIDVGGHAHGANMLVPLEEIRAHINIRTMFKHIPHVF